MPLAPESSCAKNATVPSLLIEGQSKLPKTTRFLGGLFAHDAVLLIRFAPILRWI
jgi:hypothetical protein